MPTMSQNQTSATESKAKPRPVNIAKKYWWATAVAVPLAVSAIEVSPSLIKKESPTIQVTRDSHDLNFQQISIVEREYREKTGQSLPPDIRQQIQEALRSIQQQRYEDGIPLLQAAAQKAAVPSVLANLGHALATTGKSTEARKVYDQLAAVDPSNRQIINGRQYLSELTHNNTIFTAANIPLQKTINSTLLDNDTDFFKFTAPSGPRDLLRVRLQNPSSSLGFSLAVKDVSKAPIGQASGAAAADITYEFADVPGATYYLQVSPYYTGGGAYSLIVEPTHSFDAYEPNDTILTAKDIPTGSPIEANIMDERDTDFYRFRARGAKTTIEVENRSTTLGIALAVTDADKAPIGGQTGSAAANVRYEFASTPGSVYQVQISPYYSQGGKYALTIR